MAGKYTPNEVSLLTSIRSDILARPTAYADGENFLRTEYGQERLHQVAMAKWKRRKDDPMQKATNRVVAREESKGIADTGQKKARFREVLTQLKTPPQAEQWTPAACVSQAMQKLKQAQGEHHDAKAKRSCC